MQYQLVSIRNKRKRTLKSLVLGFVLLSAACLPAQVSLAAGTAAGTPITNQATANYTVGGTNYTENSNTTTTSVAEILNVDVVWQDADNVTVSPGEISADVNFTVVTVLMPKVEEEVVEEEEAELEAGEAEEGAEAGETDESSEEK